MCSNMNGTFLYVCVCRSFSLPFKLSYWDGFRIILWVPKPLKARKMLYWWLWPSLWLHSLLQCVAHGTYSWAWKQVWTDIASCFGFLLGSHTTHAQTCVHIYHILWMYKHTYVCTCICTYIYGPTFHAGTRVRVAASGMLFKHSINLHLQTVASISVGKIMSLVSSDVHRFDQVRTCICMLVKSHNSIPQCHSVKICLWCSEKSTFNNVEYSAFKMLCAWEPSGRSKPPQQCDCLGGMACIYALLH